MKRRTRIAVFITSMALTTGCLIAFAGPRHCAHGHNQHHVSCMNADSQSVCNEVNNQK
jgi:hypothetical protein